MQRLLTATAMTALIASPAFADDTHMIEEVDVQFELTAVGSKVAAEFWSDLEGDLEEAIITRVADRLGENGSEISIDIDELEISNTFQGAVGLDSTLLGSVSVKNQTDSTKNSFYDLTVTAREIGTFQVVDGTTEFAAVEREKVYGAIIDTFAEGVVKRLR